jgi:hypothetical protein
MRKKTSLLIARREGQMTFSPSRFREALKKNLLLSLDPGIRLCKVFCGTGAALFRGSLGMTLSLFRCSGKRMR